MAAVPALSAAAAFAPEYSTIACSKASTFVQVAQSSWYQKLLLCSLAHARSYAVQKDKCVFPPF
jgi:hypothetical protein